MKENAWRNMNTASRGGKRSSTWSTTGSAYQEARSLGRFDTAPNSGGHKGAGQAVSIASEEGLKQRIGKQLEPEPWIDVLLLGRQYGYGFAQGSAGISSGSEPFLCRGGAIAARTDLPKER